MNVAEWLAATARVRPHAPALLTGFDLDADYQTFAWRSAAIGAALSRDYGIARGDRVALFATNCTQYLECLYGIWWMGAVAIPINAKLHGREAAWICSDAGAKLVFVSDDTVEALMEAKGDLPAGMKMLSVESEGYRALREGQGRSMPIEREVDDLAWLFYTSGTTGRPKGVMLSHGNLVAMTMCYLADIRDAIATMGQRFVQIYGQGESPMTITALSREWHGRTDHPRYLERLASVGMAQSVMSVRITGADGTPLPAGETGEVEAKGAAVMLGYWNNPKANAEALKDGWLRTGDVGRLDEDGFLTLSDRSKDVIISGGANIYPREVEEALLTHADVREVSAIGVPDSDWGEIVVACVVLEEGAAADDARLDAHCLASIARFKRPKRYVYLDALPKNNYGKVLKTTLREMMK